MATATLVFSNTPTVLGSLEVDCTLTEVHTAENDVTEHPVEDSASISDHIRPKQRSFSMSGLISGSPNPVQGTSRVVEAQTPDGGVIRVNTSVPEDVERNAAARLEEARATLMRIRDNGELITVTTGIEAYDNMALKSLVFERDGRTGEALRFNATFVQVETVTLQTTRLEVVSEPKAKAKRVDGKKATTAGPNQTALKKMGGFIGDQMGRLVSGGG
jgi:hypothetical protein